MEINETTVRKIQQRIKRILIRYGLEHYAEDCAQEFFLRVLESKNKRQSLNHFVIDYLRKFSGRKGSAGYDQRINLEFSNSYEPQDHDSTIRNSTGTELDDRDTFSGLANRVEGRKKEIIMSYYAGYNLKQIGYIQGITESRASQIMSQAIEEIQDDYFVDELLSRHGLAKIKNLWRKD